MALAVIFDDRCVLCSGSVRFILKHERTHDMRFLSVKSAEGLTLAARFGLDPQALDRTFALVDSNQLLTESDAAIRLARELKAPWRWLGPMARLCPKFLRDRAYRAIATRRYRFFGRTEDCMVPPPSARHRFVSGPASPDQVASAVASSISASGNTG